MENLGLKVEWDLGEKEVREGMRNNRKEIENTGTTIEEVEKKVKRNLEGIVKNNKELSNSYIALSVDAEFYGNIVKKSTDPKVIAKYNAKLSEINAEMKRISNMGKAGFDDMGNAIKQTTLFSNGLVNSLSTGVERLRRLAYIIPGLGVTGLLAMAWGPLQKLVEESGLLEKRLSDAQKEAERLGEAMGSSEYKKAITSVAELKVNVDLAKDGLYDKNTVLEEYNTTIGKVAGKLTTFNDVEKALIDNADLYIEMTLKKAAATAAADKAAQAMVELRTEMLKSEEEFANGMDRLQASVASYSGNQYGTSTFDIGTFNEILKEEGAKRKKAREEQKQKEIDDMWGISADYQKEWTSMAKELGGALGLQTSDKDGEESKKTVNDAQKLFQKLADLRAEYARKSMKKDEAELQALRDRFAKIAREVEIFNLNPLNKIKIPVEQVEEIRDQALSDLQYQQDTIKSAKLYEEDLQNFLAYEKLKEEAGEEYANQRYSNEQERIRTFEKAMKAEVDQLTSAGDMSALESERVTLYEGILDKLEDARQKAADKEFVAEKKRVEQLLSTLITYDQQRLNLIVDFEKNKAILIEQGKVDELGMLERKHREELAALDDANIEKLASYRDLFESVEKMSDTAARKTISDLEALLLLDNVSEKLRKKIQKAIADAEKALSDKMKDRVMDVAQGFDEMATAASGVNDVLSNMLGLVGDVLKATVNVKDGFDRLSTGIDNYKDWKSADAEDKGGILGGVSAVAGVVGPIGQVVGAVSSVMQGVFGFLDGAAERRNEELRKEQEYYMTLSDTFDILIDKQRKLFEEKKGKNAMDAYQEAIDMVNSKIIAGRKGLEAWFDQGASWKSHSNWYIYDKELGGVLSRQKLVAMNAEEWESLLVKQPELWARLPEEVRNYAQSVIDATEQVNDLGDALKESMTGFSYNDLQRELESLVSQADMTFEDISGSFQKHMEKAVLQLMRDDSISDDMRQWYDNMVANISDGELTADEVERSKKEYEALVEEMRKRREAIMDVMGIEPEADEGRGSTMSNRIQSITHDQADVLAGQVGAIHLLMVRRGEDYTRAIEVALQQYDSLRESLLILVAIEENTRRTANNTDKLHAIENHLSEMKNNSKNTLRAGGN